MRGFGRGLYMLGWHRAHVFEGWTLQTKQMLLKLGKYYPFAIFSNLSPPALYVLEVCYLTINGFVVLGWLLFLERTKHDRTTFFARVHLDRKTTNF